MSLRTKTLLVVAATLTSLVALLFLGAAAILSRGVYDSGELIVHQAFERAFLVALSFAVLFLFLVFWWLLDHYIFFPLGKKKMTPKATRSAGEVEEGLPIRGETGLPALQKEVGQPATAAASARLMEATQPIPEEADALLQATQKSLAELRTLYAASQAISAQTDLNDLYKILYHAVIQYMGEVDFLIALYDADLSLVQIPYGWEKGEFVDVKPFPLGMGLTSILIRSRHPLMLNEDVEKRASELGAVTIGRPALSWLGVPMMVGGEVIGAVVVQDTEREKRFSQEDQRLLTTLAAQFAAAIRNAISLQSTRQQARREHLLNEVTSRIRSSVDMDTILAIAATELGKALNARRTRITLGIPLPVSPASPSSPDNIHLEENVLHPSGRAGSELGDR